MTPDPESPLWNWPWLRNAPGEVVAELRAIAKRHAWDANALACIIQLESAGNPQAQNKQDGRVVATGLIQWTESTARNYGTTMAAIYRMSQIEQLALAERYWETAYKKPPTDVGDYYLGVFWPAGLGKSDETVIAKEGSNVYNWNKGLDITKDGILTIGDVRNIFRAKYRAFETSGALVPQPIRVKGGFGTILKVTLAGMVTFGAFRLYQYIKQSRGNHGKT
jgi:hypothetical protein